MELQVLWLSIILLDKNKFVCDLNRGMSKMNKSRMLKLSCFLLLLSLFLGVGIYKPVPVKAAAAYKVTFNNNTGTSKAKGYAALNKTVKKNAVFTVPAVPKIAGYQGLGWTTAKGKTKPLYKPGTKIKVTKNINFYVVRRKSKYNTMTFYYGNGKTDSTYKKLTMVMEEGTTAKLPSVPLRAGYENLGWSSVKNSTKVNFPEGKTICPGRNWSFYAVQKKGISLTLCNSAGTKIYCSVTVKAGQKVCLPTLKNASGKTMMGWSVSRNKRTNAEYQPGEYITVNQSTKLYAAVYNRNYEENLTKEDLMRWHSVLLGEHGKYDKIIMVGDSRMYHTRLLLQNQYGIDNLDGVEFICKSGSGLSWLKSTAYPQLKKQIEGRTAVIFNHGVNDLNNISNYISFMKKIEPELKKMGCDLYYMSVNPVNSKNMVDYYGSTGKRSENGVIEFNSAIKNNLCRDGSYRYIDSYSYLLHNGYGTDRGFGLDTGVDDGLHYSTKTFKRILDYALHSLYVMYGCN